MKKARSLHHYLILLQFINSLLDVLVDYRSSCGVCCQQVELQGRDDFGGTPGVHWIHLQLLRDQGPTCPSADLQSYCR